MEHTYSQHSDRIRSGIKFCLWHLLAFYNAATSIMPSSYHPPTKWGIRRGEGVGKSQRYSWGIMRLFSLGFCFEQNLQKLKWCQGNHIKAEEHRYFTKSIFPTVFSCQKTPGLQTRCVGVTEKKPRLCVRQVSTTSTPSPSRSLRPKWKSSSPLFLQFSSPFDEDKPLYLPTALFKSQSLCDQIFDKKHTINLQSLRETNFLPATLGESEPRQKLSLACDIKKQLLNDQSRTCWNRKHNIATNSSKWLALKQILSKNLHKLGWKSLLIFSKASVNNMNGRLMFLTHHFCDQIFGEKHNHPSIIMWNQFWYRDH